MRRTSVVLFGALALAVCFCVQASAEAADALYRRGVEAADQKNFSEALRLLKAAAAKGSPKAENSLGIIYQKGYGVGIDDVEALKWFRKAAAQGDADAESNVGSAYEHAWGVAPDIDVAVRFYRRAAQRGSNYGRNNLGMCYLEGHGLPKDAAQAGILFKLAAAAGNQDAQFNLGMLYLWGKGVERNVDLTQHWLEAAAAQRDGQAALELGQLYEQGVDLPRDVGQARRWLEAAAADGMDASKDLAALNAGAAGSPAPDQASASPGGAEVLSTPDQVPASAAGGPCAAFARPFATVQALNRGDLTLGQLKNCLPSMDERQVESIASGVTDLAVQNFLSGQKMAVRALAENLHLSEPLALRFAGDECPDCHAVLALQTPYDSVQALLAKDPQETVRSMLVGNARLSTRVLAMLVADPQDSVREQIAFNRRLDAASMASLAQDGDVRVRANLAANPSLPPALVAQFSRDLDNMVRAGLARNGSITAAVMESLDKDRAPEVRAALATNPSLEPEIQAAFAKDKDPQVRRALATNPHLDPATAAVLSKDGDTGVQEALNQMAEPLGPGGFRHRHFGRFFRDRFGLSEARETPPASGSSPSLGGGVPAAASAPVGVGPAAANQDQQALSMARELVLDTLGPTALAGDTSLGDALAEAYATHAQKTDLRPLLLYFESDEGKRFCSFQIRAEAIFEKGTQRMAENQGRPLTVPPQFKDPKNAVKALKGYMDLMSLFTRMVVVQEFIEDTQKHHGDMSGAAAVFFTEGAVINTEADALDQLRRDYTGDLDRFAAFIHSPLGQRHFDNLLAFRTVAQEGTAAAKNAIRFAY